MDSFEKSVQQSTEVRLNDDSVESFQLNGEESMAVLRGSKFGNGGAHIENGGKEVLDGKFGALPDALDRLQLRKTKYRYKIKFFFCT